MNGSTDVFTWLGKWEKFGDCWRDKGNFIMINEFKYGQNQKIWPSPLRLSI